MNLPSPNRWPVLAGVLGLAATLLMSGCIPFPIPDPLTPISPLGSVNGLNPTIGALLVAADGSVYGVTQNGGAYNGGTVYHRTTDGTVTVLHSFGQVNPTTNVTDGTHPEGGLIFSQDGTTLYGTTQNGGNGNSGTVFSLSTDGTTYAILHSFDGTDGSNPGAALLLSQDGTTLYGTAQDGGDGNFGTIFSLGTGGANFVLVYSFDNATVGGNPLSPLIQGPDGTFYGTASNYGPYGHGSLFAFTLADDGTASPTILRGFGTDPNNADHTNNSGDPTGNLVLNNGLIYGTTYDSFNGDGTPYGTIYAVNTDGSDDVLAPPLRTFSNEGDGSHPYGGLTLLNGLFYGTVANGGSGDGGGLVFSYDPNAGVLNPLHSFSGSDGDYPLATVIPSADGTTLYGTTLQDGVSIGGTLFSLLPDGSNFTDLNNFFVDRAAPQAALIQIPAADGTVSFYGTTQAGGTSNLGTVFRVDANGVTTTLHTFTGGKAPVAEKVAAAKGRAARKSQAHARRAARAAVQPDAVGAVSDGANPTSALLAGPDGTLYGTTTAGGDDNDGTVFRLLPDGTGFQILYSFTGGTDGADPAGALVFGVDADGNPDGFLYGLARSGGTGVGTAFKIQTDGSNFTVLHTFTVGDGGQPTAALVQGSDGLFYGTTSAGGDEGAGVIFKVSADGATFQRLHTQAASTDGSVLTSTLVEGPDGFFYGTASVGGPNGDGTVFKVAADGSSFTRLYAFSGGDGSTPLAGLTLGADGLFYGTTQNSGLFGNGTVFRVSTTSDFTVVYSFSNAGGGEIVEATAAASARPAAVSTNFNRPTNTARGTTASLLQGLDGFFYGTSDVGNSGYGVAYRLLVAPVVQVADAVATVGTPFSDQPAAFDRPDSFAASGLPAGLTINPATGIITGTPTAPGTSTVTVTATNAVGSDAETFSLVVQAAVPAITSPAPPTGTVGTAYTYQITASNDPTSFGASGLPPGLTIDPATGIVSGPPTAAGSYGVVFFATTSAGTGSASFTLTILPLAPVITSAAGANAVQGQAFTYQITASNNPTSFNATGLPPGLTVSTTAGLISGTPTTVGTFPVTLSATNAGGTTPATLTLVVSAAPVTRPVISSAANANASVGTAFVYQIAASNNPASFNATGLPAGLSVDTTTGLISGTPTAAGSFVVTLDATNAGGTGTASLALTVTATLPPPASAPAILSAASASAVTGQAFTYQIVASNNPASFAATGLPAGLSVDTTTGLISGTPTATGSFPVALTATNAAGTGTATLTLTVTATVVGTPTITSPASASAQSGVAFTYQIAGTNNPTSFTAAGLPPGLTLNTATGLISGAPTTTGTFTVTLTATNASGTGTASLALTVTATLPPPASAPAILSAASASAVTGQAFTYQIVASNNPASFAATGLPAGLSVDTTTGLISGTPTATGSFPVALTATNAAGTGTATLTLTVTATVVGTPTITSPASASAQSGVAFTYQIAGTNNPTSFTAAGLPPGLTLNTATGLISGAPTTTGTFTVTLTATNASGTGTASVSLLVTPAAVVTPVVTSAAMASGQVAVAFSYQITASNSPIFFGATGLPAGLTLDDQTGVISGTPTTAGAFPVTVAATNSAGTGTATLTLTIAAQPLPVITIIASVPNVTLGTDQRALFALTRTGGDQTQTLVVNYQVSGSATPGVDYLALKGTRTFKPNKMTVRINVTPQGTLGGVSRKGIKVTLLPGDGYVLGTATEAHVHILAAP